MKLMRLNTGRAYKCYSDETGFILGAVREHEDGDGTYIAYENGEKIGDYITQQAAVDAVESSIKFNPLYEVE